MPYNLLNISNYENSNTWILLHIRHGWAVDIPKIWGFIPCKIVQIGKWICKQTKTIMINKLVTRVFSPKSRTSFLSIWNSKYNQNFLKKQSPVYWEEFTQKRKKKTTNN